MPDITIMNDLDKAIHVAFCITVPTHWKNHLQPGEHWTTHLPTLPLHFQVRWVERKNNGTVCRSRPFSREESGEMGATLGLAYAAGTASIVTGLTPFMGLSVQLMMAANAGGEKYANALKNQEAKLFDTMVWVPWTRRVHSVRMVGTNQPGLWNVGGKKKV